MFRAALYTLVFPPKVQRTLPMQSRAMREYVVRRGWTIALHVREVDSSAAKREARGESWRRRAAGTLMQSRMADWTDGAGQSQTYWQRFAPRPLDNQVKPLDAECARITWMSSDGDYRIGVLQGTLDLIVLRVLKTMGAPEGRRHAGPGACGVGTRIARPFMETSPWSALTAIFTAQFAMPPAGCSDSRGRSFRDRTSL